MNSKGVNRIGFLNTMVDNVTMEEAVNHIEILVKSDKNSYVVTPNVDHIVKLENDDELKEVYKEADLILTDGMPLIWISKLLKKNIKEKVSGSDIFPNICEVAAKKKYSIFLLGAAEGIANNAAIRLREKYDGLNIVGVFSPSYGFEKNAEEIEEIIRIINKAKPDILAVGLGAPKQEKFIYKYRKRLNVPVSLAIGATIDFEAGNVKRAPIWMQKSGLEWFYRLCKEPKRMFKRYIIDDLEIVVIFLKYKNGKLLMEEK